MFHLTCEQQYKDNFPGFYLLFIFVEDM